MFKVNIANQSQNLAWEAKFDSQELAQAWLNSQIGKPHRLPEREVQTFDENGQPILDGNGNPVMETLPAEFTFEIVDISAQVALESQKQAARELLIEGDWKRNRHLSQKALGVQTSLSDEEYLAMEQACQSARELL